MGDNKEYIERGALLENLKKQYGEELGWQCTVNMSDVGMMIEEAPAADVVEVRHGYWKNYGAFCVCSVWGESNPRTKPYCPNCGAKMGGDMEDKP